MPAAPPLRETRAPGDAAAAATGEPPAPAERGVPWRSLAIVVMGVGVLAAASGALWRRRSRRGTEE